MQRNIIRIFAGVIGATGVIILVWVFLPILSYQLTAPSLMTFLSPIPNDSQYSTIDNNADYTKASSWFPGAKAESNDTFYKQSLNEPSSYKLSVPRLGITNATVSIGGEDLALSLVQYPGTALPGKIGDAVIFGHSVLPAFYNPTNYLTIFSTLPTLGIGDNILVNYDGITYKYQVEDKFEVDPTDIGILDQNDTDSFLTLVTCVPPGLQTRRLIVKARIVPVQNYDNTRT